ncbi:hypothetical protein F901_01790 [Acinetobacter dispersus]|uniref:aspartyl/asparaginyl beta-hydroxylase domain-containing protein n=1 Tax=Acinetobacter dispersus TaxID=70348 RepID=UPI0002CE3230|nr:aspartyl/asparaginyl beta-hydroxylase domain-containing protein [Acinetobacter dispersus]ENX54482.1 hypothetical protein F901_01790 [Acinetobacter dispersus]
MHSKILGVMENNVNFNDDIHNILNFSNENNDYKEFRVGDWRTFVIRNSSGLDDDGLIQSGNFKLKITPRGEQIMNINNWIDHFFNTTLLRLARVHSMGDGGVLIPHRDFLELGEEGNHWFRVHIPIKTNDSCLHAENDEIFHMRQGEIWFLDAKHLHSATNSSPERRLNLCLDFEIKDLPYQSIFKKPIDEVFLPTPKMIKRENLNSDFVNGLHNLSKVITKENYWDIVGFLSKVPFYKNTGLSSFYEWMLKISEQSGDEYIFSKTKQFCQFLKAERKMYERFVI